jgi:hypothetical protein
MLGSWVRVPAGSQNEEAIKLVASFLLNKILIDLVAQLVEHPDFIGRVTKFEKIKEAI